MLNISIDDSKSTKSVKLNHLLAGAISFKVINETLSSFEDDESISKDIITDLKKMWIQSISSHHPGVLLPSDRAIIVTELPRRLTEVIPLSTHYPGAKYPDQYMEKPLYLSQKKIISNNRHNDPNKLIVREKLVVKQNMDITANQSASSAFNSLITSEILTGPASVTLQNFSSSRRGTKTGPLPLFSSTHSPAYGALVKFQQNSPVPSSLSSDTNVLKMGRISQIYTDNINHSEAYVAITVRFHDGQEQLIALKGSKEMVQFLPYSSDKNKLRSPAPETKSIKNNPSSVVRELMRNEEYDDNDDDDLNEDDLEEFLQTLNQDDDDDGDGDDDGKSEGISGTDNLNSVHIVKEPISIAALNDHQEEENRHRDLPKIEIDSNPINIHEYFESFKTCPPKFSFLPKEWPSVTHDEPIELSKSEDPDTPLDHAHMTAVGTLCKKSQSSGRWMFHLRDVYMQIEPNAYISGDIVLPSCTLALDAQTNITHSLAKDPTSYLLRLNKRKRKR